MACIAYIRPDLLSLGSDPLCCFYRTQWTAEGSVFLRCQSVFFVCARNISGTAERICAKFTRKTYLVPRSDEFEGQTVKVKGQGHQGQKRHFSAHSAACVRFMFGTTSLASSLNFSSSSVLILLRFRAVDWPILILAHMLDISYSYSKSYSYVHELIAACNGLALCFLYYDYGN